MEAAASLKLQSTVQYKWHVLKTCVFASGYDCAKPLLEHQHHDLPILLRVWEVCGYYHSSGHIYCAQLSPGHS